MKILVVHPFRNMGSPEFAIVSFGYIASANTLRRMGHDVVGVNLPMEQALYSDRVVNLNGYLKKINPDLVLISFHWYEFLNGALAAAREVRNYNPQMLCVCAGMSATFFSEWLLKTGLFSYVLRDGEDSIVSLMNSLKQNKNNLAEQTYNDENFIDISFLLNHTFYFHTNINGLDENSKKGFWVNVARSCIFNCEYCGGSQFAHATFYNRKSLIVKPFERVYEELNLLISQGVECVSFSHDVELLPYCEELIKLLGTLPVDVYFESFGLPKLRTLDLIKESQEKSRRKWKIAITAISGNEIIRYREGKQFSNQKLLEVVNKCSESQIEVEVYFTLNCNNETVEKFCFTTMLLKQLLECGDHVNPLCLPYYQQEIGSVRWAKQGISIDESANMLIDYLRIPHKTSYFIKEDPCLVQKIRLWNEIILEHQKENHTVAT